MLDQLTYTTLQRKIRKAILNLPEVPYPLKVRKVKPSLNKLEIPDLIWLSYVASKKVA